MAQELREMTNTRAGWPYPAMCPEEQRKLVSEKEKNRAVAQGEARPPSWTALTTFYFLPPDSRAAQMYGPPLRPDSSTPHTVSFYLKLL